MSKRKSLPISVTRTMAHECHLSAMKTTKGPYVVTQRHRFRRNLDQMFGELFESGDWFDDLRKWEEKKQISVLGLQDDGRTGPPYRMKSMAGDVRSIAWHQEPPMKKNVLQSPLLILRRALRVLGVVPYTYDDVAKEYQLSWRRIPGLLTLLTALYMTILFVTAAVGIVRMFFFRAEVQSSPHDDADFGTKAMGAVVLFGCLVNAWAELLNAVYAGRRLVRLLNSWNVLVAQTGLDPTEGLRTPARVQVGFLFFFSLAMIVMTATGKPAVVTHVIDGVGEAFFMIPPQWLTSSPEAKVTLFYLCIYLSIHISVCL